MSKQRNVMTISLAQQIAAQTLLEMRDKGYQPDDDDTNWEAVQAMADAKPTPPKVPDARSLRTKHLERAHRNLDLLEKNGISPSMYAAALAAAADGYMAGYLAANGEGVNPFLDMETPA